MYQIAYIGRWETLPETAAAICDHDTPKLEALLQQEVNHGHIIPKNRDLQRHQLDIFAELDGNI